MKKNRIYAAITLLVAVFCTVSVSQAQESKSKQDFNLGKNAEIFINALRHTSIAYVDTVNSTKLVEKGLKTMLTELDPYTEYIPAQEMENFEFGTTLKYGGVGALIRKEDISGDSSYVRIAEVYKGFPADKAGFRPGDRIVTVDGKNMRGKPTEAVSSAMKGDPGSEIVMTVVPLGETKEKTITFKRERVSINPVAYSGFVNDSIGYISFSTFSQGGAAEMRRAIEKMKSTGKLKRLILDLRGNGGGIVDEAVDVVGLFVPKGTTVVINKGREGKVLKTYTTNKEPIAETLPLVVMVSSSSASASEIVSGALQDLDRAVIVGRRTFGKGLVQATQHIGYGNYVKVTIAKYYTPSGRCIQAMDYSHRNEDGSVGHIPDSLMTEFKTIGGRSVYDGGGVDTDVKLPAETISKFTAGLIAYGYFDDFALEYRKKNPKAPDLATFQISDKVYADFAKFLADKNLDYKSYAEGHLDKLREAATREKTIQSIQADLDRIAAQIGNNKVRDLELYKNEIKEQLISAIIPVYYYNEQRVQKLLEYDNECKQAINIVSSKDDMKKYLSTSLSKK